MRALRIQQDLQILVLQKRDLAAHVVEHALHVVQVGAHLRQIVAGSEVDGCAACPAAVCLILPILGAGRACPPLPAPIASNSTRVQKRFAVSSIRALHLHPCFGGLPC